MRCRFSRWVYATRRIRVRYARSGSIHRRRIQYPARTQKRAVHRRGKRISHRQYRPTTRNRYAALSVKSITTRPGKTEYKTNPVPAAARVYHRKTPEPAAKRQTENPTPAANAKKTSPIPIKNSRKGREAGKRCSSTTPMSGRARPFHDAGIWVQQERPKHTRRIRRQSYTAPQAAPKHRNCSSEPNCSSVESGIPRYSDRREKMDLRPFVFRSV